MRDLETLRKEIDRIDAELLPLFLRRMDVCREVAEYKRSVNMPVLDREREQQVLQNKLDRLEDKSRGPEVYEFFSCLMSISRDAQNRALAAERKELSLPPELLTVREPVSNPRAVYQGTAGAYSEEALVQYFGEDSNRFAVKTWEDACEAVTGQKADYAVLPIENSYTGSIADVMDLLGQYNLFIAGETDVSVRHCLLAPQGATPDTIRTVYSHEQGLRQCNAFLKQMKNIVCETFPNTAVSAKYVAEHGDVTKAAIASKRTAKLYGLQVLAEDINQSATNTTRFVVVAAHPELNPDCNKISAAFTLPHESGTLHRVLSAFAQGGLNLLKIESRPIRERNFEYRFYVDYTGNLLDEHVKAVTENVIGQTLDFKLLGNYKTGVLK